MEGNTQINLNQNFAQSARIIILVIFTIIIINYNNIIIIDTLSLSLNGKATIGKLYQYFE